MFPFLAPPQDKIANVRKIAVLRANGLGDYLFALPAVEALRAAYPDAEIVWLGRGWHAAFLNGRPGPIDRAISVPSSHGVNANPHGETVEDAEELAQFFEQMRAEQFDLALQMHGGGGNSNPFLKRLGARVNVGLCVPEAPKLDRWMPYRLFQPEIMRYLELVALVGAEPVTLAPRLTPSAADRDEAARVLAEFEIAPTSTQPLVVLHPSSTEPKRCWPVANFARVGDALAERGAHVAIIGDEHDGTLINSLVGQMRSEPIALHGRLSLGGLLGLLARADLLIGNDSGPRHVAEAAGAATIGIYWAGNLITAGSLTRTRHRPQLSWQMHCPVCGANYAKQEKCEHDVSLVADVAVEAVEAEALSLLALSKV